MIGVLKIHSIELNEVKWNEISEIVAIPGSKIKLRVQLMANYLSIDGEALCSAETSLENPFWGSNDLPELFTPLNNIDLIKSERLIMLVWARDAL